MTDSPVVSRRRIGGRAADRHLESYDVRTSHAIEIDAAPAETYRAVRNVDLGRSLPILALAAVRGIPHFVTGKVRPSRSITVDTILQLGFTILEEKPPSDLVMGAVGRFWRPDSGLVPVTPEEFRSFEEPGYARATMSFTVEEHGRGSLLETETRVACTDASALRRFSLYWRVIGPFSGLIRRLMLDQVKRAAERAPAG
jgi:hypothetical protein